MYSEQVEGASMACWPNGAHDFTYEELRDPSVLETVAWWYHWLMGSARRVYHAVAWHKNDDGRDYE